MSKRRAFLIAQALLCALVAGLLAYAAIGLYAEGVAVQRETGDLFDYIYTREKVAARLAPILPLMLAAMGMTVAGWILDIRDENADRPVPMPMKAGNPQNPRAVAAVRAALLIIAAALIVAGIVNGGLEDVFTKANAICMECVGLG